MNKFGPTRLDRTLLLWMKMTKPELCYKQIRLPGVEIKSGRQTRLTLKTVQPDCFAKILHRNPF